MNDTVTVITSNLSYKQAIFSLLVLEASPESCVENQVYRDTVRVIVNQTLENVESEITIIESIPDIEGSMYFK